MAKKKKASTAPSLDTTKITDTIPVNTGHFLRKIYEYNRTFSGTDTIAFIILPGCSPVVLGSVTTISYSMLRNKKPVINIGRTNINGLTRGSRIYAGSMVFTLINQYWVNEIREMDGISNWLGHIEDLKADELPPFDIQIVSANEYGAWCSMYIYGVDFTDEAQTISVEDLFTENVFQFVARDVWAFRGGKDTLIQENSEGSSGNFRYQAKEYNLFIMDNSAVNDEDIFNIELTKWEWENKEYNYEPVLRRDLSENNSMHPLVGDDVASLQQNLKAHGYNVEITGVFDHETSVMVKLYQQEKGLYPSGIVDNELFVMLLNDNTTASESKVVSVNRIDGCYIYKDADLNSDIVDYAPYENILKVFGTIDIQNQDGTQSKWYTTEKGYVRSEDVFNSNNWSYASTPYKISKEVMVKSAKNALSIIYDYDPVDSDILDKIDISYLNTFQREHSLIETDDITYADYVLLMAEAERITSSPEAQNVSINAFEFKFSIPPGEYNVTTAIAAGDYLDDYICTIINTKSINATCNLKFSAIAEFDDGTFETHTMVFEVKDGVEFNFGGMQPAFIYSPTKGSMPKFVTIYVYPYDNTAYKWSFNIMPNDPNYVAPEPVIPEEPETPEEPTEPDEPVEPTDPEEPVEPEEP